MLLNTWVVGSCYFKIHFMSCLSMKGGGCSISVDAERTPASSYQVGMFFLKKDHVNGDSPPITQLVTWNCSCSIEIGLDENCFTYVRTRKKSFLHIWGIHYLKLKACPWKLVVGKLLSLLLLGRPTFVPSAATINRQERSTWPFSVGWCQWGRHKMTAVLHVGCNGRSNPFLVATTNKFPCSIFWKMWCLCHWTCFFGWQIYPNSVSHQGTLLGLNRDLSSTVDAKISMKKGSSQITKAGNEHETKWRKRIVYAMFIHNGPMALYLHVSSVLLPFAITCCIFLTEPMAIINSKIQSNCLWFRFSLHHGSEKGSECPGVYDGLYTYLVVRRISFNNKQYSVISTCEW